MKHKLLPLLLAMSLLLGGCGWLNGSFVSVTPHEAPKQVAHADTITAANYKDFLAALKQLVAAGTEVAGHVVLQMMSTDPNAAPTELVLKRAERDGLYAALDLASAWLDRQLGEVKD